jgi:hypothetical protein
MILISVEKSKVIASRGKEPKRRKIIIDSQSIEQVNTFNYLGTLVSYENEIDIGNKISKFLKTTRTQQNNKEYTRIRLYSTLAPPVLLFGSESWTVKAKDKARFI